MKDIDVMTAYATTFIALFGALVMVTVKMGLAANPCVQYPCSACYITPPPLKKEKRPQLNGNDKEVPSPPFAASLVVEKTQVSSKGPLMVISMSSTSIYPVAIPVVLEGKFALLHKWVVTSLVQKCINNPNNYEGIVKVPIEENRSWGCFNSLMECRIERNVQEIQLFIPVGVALLVEDDQCHVKIVLETFHVIRGKIVWICLIPYEKHISWKALDLKHDPLSPTIILGFPINTQTRLDKAFTIVVPFMFQRGISTTNLENASKAIKIARGLQTAITHQAQQRHKCCGTFTKSEFALGFASIEVSSLLPEPAMSTTKFSNWKLKWAKKE
uniref:Uncharacterized protein n=1 Tax=Timema shepardi TaxID=629360 RepID=A0A7R9ARA4_TIMSH|nr:unnamed protein product [Timema shepardi]